MTTNKTDYQPTASDLYLVRLMNENARLARQVANLRENLRKKAVEADSTAATIAGLRDGMQKLTDRLNAAEGRSSADLVDETIWWRSWACEITKCDPNIADSAMRGGVDNVIDNLRREVVATKRKHAEDDRALVEAHARELREAKEAHAKEVADLRARLADLALVPAHVFKGPGPDESYRGTILRECAHECTIHIGPEVNEMRVVVGLRDGKTLDDVAAVLERMGRAPGTYSLREVKTPRPPAKG